LLHGVSENAYVYGGAIANRWNGWGGKASSRHASKKGRNGPPFWLFYCPTRSHLSLSLNK